MRLPVEPMRGACPGLSQRELAMLAHVAASIEDTGVQPTYRDIQKFLGYKSTNSIMSIIQKLLMKGVIWETTGHGFAFDWKAYLRFRSLVHGRKICGTVRGTRSTSSVRSLPANCVEEGR